MYSLNMWASDQLHYASLFFIVFIEQRLCTMQFTTTYDLHIQYIELLLTYKFIYYLQFITTQVHVLECNHVWQNTCYLHLTQNYNLQ